MTTDNPQVVLVTAEIDIHQAIKAVVEFAKKYPVERLSHDQVYDLRDASDLIDARIGEAWRSTHLPPSSVTP